MATTLNAAPSHDPLAAKISAADDRILLNHWLPPREGIVPRVRLGTRWISVLWALPLGFAGLILAIALAQGLLEFPAVKTFVERYPGIAQAAPSVDSGFPWFHPAPRQIGADVRLVLVVAGQDLHLRSAGAGLLKKSSDAICAAITVPLPDTSA